MTKTGIVVEGPRLGSEMVTEVTSMIEAEGVASTVDDSGVATMEDDFEVATMEEEDSVAEVTPGIARVVGLPRVMTISVGPLEFMTARG